MGKTVDISAIQGYAEKHDKKLISQTLNSLSFVKDLNVRRNVREDFYLNKVVMGDGLRRLNTEISASKSKRTFTRRKLEIGAGMKIFSVVPEELRETFLSEMLDPNAKDVPFAEWMWAREFEKLQSEIEDSFYLSEKIAEPAQWAAATAYSSGDHVYFNDIVYKANQAVLADESPSTHPAKWDDVDANVIFDGPGTIIAREILASNLTPVATGAYDNTNAYEAYLTQWNALTTAHKGKISGITAFASFDSVQDLVSDVNKTFGSGQGIGGVDIEEGKEFILKGTGGRLRIKPVTWMGSSRRIIMTPKANMVVGLNQNSDSNKIGKIVENLHGFDAITKFLLGFQIADLEALYVNNQA